MRGESKWQPQLRCQPCAKVARSKEGNWNQAALARNRFDHLPRPFRPKIAPKFLQQVRKIICALLQVAPQSPHGMEIATRCSSQSEIDPTWVQRLQCAELFSHYEWSMIRQHPPAATYANCLRRRGHMPNQHRSEERRVG